MTDLPGRYRHHGLYRGGDLTPDSRTPEWQIPQAVPDTAGTLIIDVLTRDADDASLTGLDQFDELAANMAAIAERGLNIPIAELDVAIVNDDSEQTQADVYERIVDICLAQLRCTVLQSWGFTDRYSFRTSQLRPYLSRDYAGKLSYQALGVADRPIASSLWAYLVNGEESVWISSPYSLYGQSEPPTKSLA